MRIDAFVVLPHEGGGKNGGRTSFARKTLHHTKLKTKARIGHKCAGKEGPGHDGHVHGHEVGNRGSDSFPIRDSYELWLLNHVSGSFTQKFSPMK